MGSKIKIFSKLQNLHIILYFWLSHYIIYKEATHQTNIANKNVEILSYVCLSKKIVVVSSCFFQMLGQFIARGIADHVLPMNFLDNYKGKVDCEHARYASISCVNFIVDFQKYQCLLF